VVDNSGVTRQHVQFDTYGRRLREVDRDSSGTIISSADIAAIDEFFGYTGRDWDVDAGLQYNRARWYDPAQGRWLIQDPIGFDGGDANLYRYVGNGPTNATDPSGLASGVLGWLGSWFGYESDEDVAARAKFWQEDRLRERRRLSDPPPLPFDYHGPGEMRAYTTNEICDRRDREYRARIRQISDDIYQIGVQAMVVAGAGARGNVSARRAPSYPRTQVSNVRPYSPSVDPVKTLPVKLPHPEAGVYPKNPLSTPISKGTKPGTYVYVQDENGIVHIVPNGNHLHPTVLGGGRSAAAAGEITIGLNGVVTEINNISFTFQHGAETLPGVRSALEKSGLQCTPDSIKPFGF